MSLGTDLSSSDLAAVRESALGAADPLGVAADLAAAADKGGLADPADAGYALELAAEIAESRHKLEAALDYAERAVAANGERDDSRAASAQALRARILFRAERGDEAFAALEPLRGTLTQFPDAAAYLSSALVVGGRARTAEEWLTEAVKGALAERSAEPANADDAGVLFFLLEQRHRLRHALGLPHDTHDNLAERLETRLANANAATASTGSGGDLVFWAQSEFEQLLAKWPTLADAYGADWDDHRARVETQQVKAGAPGLIRRGSVAGLSGVGDPTEAATRAEYARKLAAAPGGIPWPPERNGACWCGSGNKYKKCCLPRSRA